MKRIVVVSIAALMMAFGVSGGWAAQIQMDIPSTIAANTAGSLNFGVYLTNMGALPNVDFFNLEIQVTGASGLQMPRSSVTGPTLANYIFYGNSFGFTTANPGGDVTKIAVGDATLSGTGVSPSSGHNLLAEITLAYPALAGGTALDFSLIANQNFEGSSAGAGATENFGFTGLTEIRVPQPTTVPEPGAIWLLITGVMGLIGARGKFLQD